MRPFTYNALLDDYLFMCDVVRRLGDEAFEFMTPAECEIERRELLEELRMDYSFKLMTKLEADVRQDFNRTIASRFRDGVSRSYQELCKTYRREIRKISQRASTACSRIPIDRILDQLRDHFSALNEDFHRVCSVTKGFFTFRHWYAHGRFFRSTPVIPDPEDIVKVYEQFEVRVFARR
jgi:hypothetical protein